MTAVCESVRERFARYADDALEPAERRQVRDHLRECRSCAEEGAETDASLLFAALAPEKVSPEEVARVVAAVRSGVELRRVEEKLSRSRSRRAAIASAAAVLALTLLLPGRLERPANRVTLADAPPRSVPNQPPQFLPGAAPASSGARYPAEATIYDWNPGSSRDEPRVVWIVDGSLDI